MPSLPSKLGNGADFVVYVSTAQVPTFSCWEGIGDTSHLRMLASPSQDVILRCTLSDAELKDTFPTLISEKKKLQQT